MAVTYEAVTSWMIASQGTSTNGNKWLGAAARIMQGSDSTAGAYHLVAEYSFYQWYAVSGETANVYKNIGATYNSATATHESLSLSGSGLPAVKGTTVTEDLGTFGYGTTVSTSEFFTAFFPSGAAAVYSNHAVATYTTPSGSNAYYNKAIIGGVTYMDISADTVAAASMLSGVTAHDKNGAPVTGTIATKTSTDMTVSGATVTAPAGYYASAASKSVASGSAATPATTITQNPTITYNSSTGKITATYSKSQSVTPTVTAGYVSSGTAGTIQTTGTASVDPETLDADITAANIKTGVQIFDVTGTYTSDATATAGEILASKTAYVNGSKVTGTMTNRGSQTSTITTKAQSVTIQAGYHDGGGSVSIAAAEQAKIIPSNILAGVTILGVEGDVELDDFVEIQASKTVNSSFEAQTVTPDTGYDYLASVVVRPIIVSSALTSGTTGYTVTVSEQS